MRVAYNDKDDRVRLRGYVQFNKYTHISYTQNDRRISSSVRYIGLQH